MSLEDEARQRALSLDRALSERASQIVMGRPTGVFLRLRAYLEHQASKLKRTEPDRNGLVSICLGPAFDKGPTPEHFLFDSGTRLSFWLMLHEENGESSLVAYSFRYWLPSGRSPEFLRFDLNRESHPDTLKKPRCHLHPGLDQVRLPLPVLDPFEVLDRIFFVIEPALLSQ